MRFGFHISIGGGISKTVERANKKGCETIQIFSRNPRGWRYNPLDPLQVKKFRGDVNLSKIFPLFIHMPYLPNLASPKEDIYYKSIESLIEDLKRAEMMGASFLIIHSGNGMETDENDAINNIASGINKAFLKVENNVSLLLENNAGQGSEIGYSFSNIQSIIERVDQGERVGVCLDTAHAFAAGYDLSTRDGLNATLDEFDRLIGITKLHLIHLNDSKTPLGSRVDRHWHIGEGEIGIKGFENIVNHPLLIRLPGIMETPFTKDADDIKNMAVIRNLVRR
ncbi:MAG: deoxyribonuclease IV [Thermodesulfobacteriota bacterium]|nr:deoxyribonuclease IV [Thermodesulfobacteriota bacterium]